MTLNELYTPPTQLDEGIFQRAVAAAALVIGGLGITSYTLNDTEPESITSNVASGQVSNQNDELAANLTNTAAAKYKVDKAIVRQVVDAALKYQHDDFPRAKDILAVVGVESSFNPKAVSQLKHDPAVGVMQIRPKVWGIDKNELSTVDGQIKHGAAILAQYYKQLGNKTAALHAYNVGLTRHRASIKQPNKANPRYAPKVNTERELYTSIKH